MIKTFEYKLRKSLIFEEAAQQALDAARWVYNSALEERIGYYKRTGKTLGFVEQSRHLTEARELPEVGATLRTIQVDALERLDVAFRGFFKRVKARDGKAGFPRFRARGRYSTFSQKIEPARYCPLGGDFLIVPGVGSVRVRLSRPIEGKVKQLRITRKADGWYACLVCEVPLPVPLAKTGRNTGIDRGINQFVVESTGRQTANPRYLRGALRALKRSQHELSRKRRRSRSREKARQRVARLHLHVQRQRRDFSHKVALDIVRRYDRVRVEKLKVVNMIRNPYLAKDIADAGWSQFLGILAYKAEWAGRRVEAVDPRYTSQTCSRCRRRTPPGHALFVCGYVDCGLALHRDHNAAINIGRSAPVKRVEGHGVRRSPNRYVRKKLGPATTAGATIFRA